MFKLIFKYLNCSGLKVCCLMSVISTSSAAPTSHLPQNTLTVASQATSVIVPNKTTISIADLAQIQQQILHQEFLKKLALVEKQNLPQKPSAEIKKNSLEASTHKTNSSDKKVTIKIKPMQQLKVLAIYGPLTQQTAEIFFNGRLHIVSNPSQLGGFKLVGIHHNKIFVQAVNLSQKPLNQATSISTVHSNPVYELLTGQQLEVQP